MQFIQTLRLYVFLVLVWRFGHQVMFGINTITVCVTRCHQLLVVAITDIFLGINKVVSSHLPSSLSPMLHHVFVISATKSALLLAKIRSA
jgi:hypothetical protein